MADENKLDGDDAANFGNSLSAEQGGAIYVANFEGDEIDGVTYAMGDTIPKAGSPPLDAGTAAYLVQIGRITPTSADSDHSPAGGSTDGLTPEQPGSGEGEGDTIELSDEEQAEADQLVADNSRDDLVAMLPEGASTAGNKSDLAARIVAGQR